MFHIYSSAIETEWNRNEMELALGKQPEANVEDFRLLKVKVGSLEQRAGER